LLSPAADESPINSSSYCPRSWAFLSLLPNLIIRTLPAPSINTAWGILVTPYASWNPLSFNVTATRCLSW
jgi:hypothetical protein